MMPAARLAGVVCVAALLAVATSSACDAFSHVRCEAADDCPGELPACRGGVCVKARAADEATDVPASCDGDDQCGGGLCYDRQDDSGFFGTCVPPPGLDDCALAASAERDFEGPALVRIDAELTLSGAVTLFGLHLDRQHDLSAVGGGFIEASYDDGSTERVSGALADGSIFTVLTSPQLIVAPFVVRLVDAAGNGSNTACISRADMTGCMHEECSPALCMSVFADARYGSCIAGEQGSCAAAAALGTRPADGPVLFDVVVVAPAGGGDCAPLTAHALSRADVTSGPRLRVLRDDAEDGDPPVLIDAEVGADVRASLCGVASGDVLAVQLVDDTGARSNAPCVSVP